MRPGRLAALLAIVVPSAAFAQATSPEDVARRYVEARKAKNPEAQLALYHPAVQACLAANPWYREMIRANAVRSASSGATFADGFRSNVTPVTGKTPVYLMPDSLFAYPVEASHQLEIQSREGPTTATAAFFFIAKSGTAWYTLIPCPKPGAQEWAKRQSEAGARQQARADSLVNTLKDPLRAELLDLLKQGKKVSAVFRYMEVTHADNTTAVMVVEALQKRKD